MCKRSYAGLTFDHMVIFKQDQSVFAKAREMGTEKTFLFLVSTATGIIYAFDALRNRWETLHGEAESTVREAVNQSMHSGITVYKLQGNFRQVMAIGYNVMA